MVIFSEVQKEALGKAEEWLKAAKEWDNPGEQVLFKMFGFAGTGKSTIASTLAGGRRVAYMAYTGKAARVMQSKGCEGAATIHSSIYALKTDEIMRVKREIRKAEGTPLEAVLKQQLEELHNKPAFFLAPRLDVQLTELIIVDECSMVNEEIGQDLLSIGVPVLVMGDTFQLPPVKGEGFFMQGTPDVLLSEVHRQAADNPVLALATAIRSFTPWPVLGEGQAGLSYLGDATVVTIMDTLLKGGQVLCGKNTTRVLINTRARQCLGFTNPNPQPGDRLVCLQNNKDEGLLNGSQWFVRQVLGASGRETLKVELQEEAGTRVHVTEMHLGKLNGGDAGYFQTKGYSLFDYGYCLTVHKAQGSQWDDVLLVNESGSFKQDAARWLYTGVTRAAKSLTLCTNVKL